jgi:hypothetical protein
VDVDPGLTASTLVNGNSQKPPKHAWPVICYINWC